jgi:hypothetical protein
MEWCLIKPEICYLIIRFLVVLRRMNGQEKGKDGGMEDLVEDGGIIMKNED